MFYPSDLTSVRTAGSGGLCRKAGSAEEVLLLHYTCKRILGALPGVFGITLFVFFLINMAPATIADAAGGGEASSAAVRAALEANLGLDKPLPLRYVLWLKALVQGDLGLSYRTGQPVVTMIAQRWCRPSS